MRSHRRLLSAVALAGVAVFALAGCRTSPTVAAYVGDTQITESQVSDIYDATVKEAPKTPLTRQDVVQALVLGELCGQLQSAKKFSSQQIDTASIAQSLGVTQGAPAVKMFDKTYSCLSGFPASSTPLTAEQKQEVLQAAIADGIFPPGSTVASVGDQIDTAQVRGAMAERDAFAQAATDVSVNPRYRQLTFPILQGQSGKPIIYVPLGQAPNGAVTDGPGEAPSAAPIEPQS
ncbi:peptidylprolyl isomerase [Hamadaea tsunoensis]|uniref:hypothetical protein n=1 Tax=Hamadaea tsunoensis TaxID=53368 RepID=UPI00040791EF|nr:hypothetical protein [Hamadaea tsunoensis]